MSFLNYELPILPTHTHEILDSSKLGSFLECPRKFFYEYMLGWRSDRPNNHLVFGSAWHDAMEHILLNGYSEDSLYDAFLLFQRTYRETFNDPDMDDLYSPKTPLRAFEALAKYAGKYSADEENFEVLHTEIAGTVPVGPNGRVMHFRLDSIIKDRTADKIFSMEHKTGSSFTRTWQDQWELDHQPLLYTHALYCNYDPSKVRGVVMNGTFFKKVKDNSRVEKYEFARVPVNKSFNQIRTWNVHLNRWIDLLEQNYELLSTESDSEDVMKSFPCNPKNCTKFFGCVYHDLCNAWPNPLRKAFQAPLGFKVEHWDPSERPSKAVWNLDLK